MNVKHILFPTDYSHTGDAALALATSLARDSNARLHIVHVEEPSHAYSSGQMYYGIVGPDTEKLKKMLAAVKPVDSTVDYKHHLITGDPAQALVQFAEEHDVDLIVMGTHGRTGLKRFLMGSVAEAVVRRAPCPVLTYCQPHDKHKGAETQEQAEEAGV